jgi:hypothetical protein
MKIIMSNINEWIKTSQVMMKKGEFQNALDKLSFVLMNDCKLNSSSFRSKNPEYEMLLRASKVRGGRRTFGRSR